MNELAIWLNKDKDTLLKGELSALILHNLRNQVAKDMGLYQDEVNPTIEGIRQSIGTAADTLWSRQDSSLKQILYAIDLDESHLRHQLSGKPMSEQIEELTEAILHREFRKVITRLYFSGKLS